MFSNKKRFIYSCIVIFLILIASPVLAGDLRGECSCSLCAGSAPVPFTLTGETITALNTECDRTCEVSHECRGGEILAGIECVVSTETLSGSECVASTSESGGSSESDTDSDSVSLTNPLGTTDIPTLIGRIIRGLLGIVGSIALLMFIYGGFTLLTSGGNTNQVQKGKNILVWATIGIVFIFVSFIAVNFVIDILVTTGE